MILAHVMISYSHEDRPFVAKLAAALKARKCEVWFDERLRPSDDYSLLIENKIVDATAVLVVWSNNARNSKWVRAEALRAFDLKKPLIQVVKEPCSPQVPFPFHIYQFTDLSDWDFDVSAPQIEEIVSALQLPPVSSQVTAGPRPGPIAEKAAAFLETHAKIKAPIGSLLAISSRCIAGSMASVCWQ
jgi:hypothetical protein